MLNESIYNITIQKLYYLRYAKKTIETYSYYIKQFLESVGMNIQRVNSSDFQKYLDNYNFTSGSQQNQVINAIRFLYKYGLDKKYEKVSFVRPRKEKHLPRIVDQELMRARIFAIDNIKHKAIIQFAFSACLRVSEVCNMKFSDINGETMLAFVSNAKGGKDRIVPISRTVLDTLEQYYELYEPTDYLFYGQGGKESRYSERSCEEIYHKYIGLDTSFHNLRHSGASGMLENGTDIETIREILGHSSIKTTQIYLHISTKHLKNAKLAA